MKGPTKRQARLDTSVTEPAVLRRGAVYQDGPTALIGSLDAYQQLAQKYNSSIIIARVNPNGVPLEAIFIYTDDVECVVECARSLSRIESFIIAYPSFGKPPYPESDGAFLGLEPLEKEMERLIDPVITTLSNGRRNINIDFTIVRAVKMVYTYTDVANYATMRHYANNCADFYDRHTVFDVKESSNEAEMIAGLREGAGEDPDEILNRWFEAKGIAEDQRAAYAAKIGKLVARASRVQWDDSDKPQELRHLSAPRFLRAVYPDAIDAAGRLVDEELVRSSDPGLVRAVQAYANQRISRSQGLGDAEGLIFTRKDQRGRPKKGHGPGGPRTA
jgi:hypothetical protein